MTIYIGLFAFITIALTISRDKTANKLNHNYRYGLFYLCAAVLTFFACVRHYSVGQDTSAYIGLFYAFGSVQWNNIISFLQFSSYESGYVLYNRILYSLFPYWQTITIANSLLFAFFTYKFMRKYSKDCIMSLFVFYAFGFYQTSFNIVSSLIAAMMIYANLDLFHEKYKWKAILIMVFAFFFHRASILLIILFFIEKIPLNKWWVFFVLLMAAACALFYPVVLPVISFLAPDQYQGYINAEHGDNGLILVFHLLIIVYLAFFKYVLKKKKMLNDEKAFLPNTINWLILMEICCFIISLRVSKFSRVAYMFTPAYFIFIPELVDEVKGYFNRIILRTSLFALIGAQFFLRLSINNIGNTIPYQFM